MTRFLSRLRSRRETKCIYCFSDVVIVGGGVDVCRIFCLACEAEARHMYCFSGVVVVVVGVVGGVNFFVFRSFSRKL